MKNVTLAIPEDLLTKSREYAKRHGTTLNEMIRDLLRKNVTRDKDDFLERLEEAQKHLSVDTKIKFDRDELHER